MRFFRRVFDVLRHGGRFVLEPQAWDTYAKAKRMAIVILASTDKLRVLLTSNCRD